MDLQTIELELKKRWVYPYIWKHKQSNDWDKRTNFIYTTHTLANLLDSFSNKFPNESITSGLFNYAINRWYNFWSAKAVESIFTQHEKVKKEENPVHQSIDFYIDEVNFDLKTTILPKNCNMNLQQAQHNPVQLTKWLYEHQSQENRFHEENRLFIVVYAHNGEHWKLKAEIGWLQTIIQNYLHQFDSNKLISLELEQNVTTLTDIIWAIK